MKALSHSYIILLIFCVLTSCHNNERKKADKQVNTTKTVTPNAKTPEQIAEDDKNARSYLVIQEVPDSIQIANTKITSLPFGDELLVTHKFPKHWETPTMDEIWVKHKPENRHSIIVQKIHHEIDNIGYYAKSITLPDIASIKHIYLNGDSAFFKDERQWKNGFKFRLSDIGPYQVYYFYEEQGAKRFDIYAGKLTEEDGLESLSIGTLMLYNPENREATVINIFYFCGYGGDSVNSSLREFYIDTGGKITICEIEMNETGMDFAKTNEITIKDDGTISVKNFDAKK